MAVTFYNDFKTELMNGTFDFTNDTVRVALLDNGTSYTPDPDAETFVDDVLDGGTTAQEFTGSGYSRQTLANVSVSADDTDDEGVFDADDTTFSSIDGATIQSALISRQEGGDDTTPGNDRLVGHYTSSDFPLTANGGDVTLQWNSEGIINVG